MNKNLKKLLKKSRSVLINRKNNNIIDRNGEIFYKENTNFELLTFINNNLKQKKILLLILGIFIEFLQM